jgi:hypothetical protein
MVVPFASTLPLACAVAPKDLALYEKLLLRWLNGEPLGPRWHKNGGAGIGTAGEIVRAHPMRSAEEDVACRSRILNDILPLLQLLANVGDEEVNFEGTPAKGTMEDQREEGFERLQDLLTKYKMVSVVDRDGKVYLYGTGPDELECWVTNVLIAMWGQDRLWRLAQCACGCGVWFFKWRADRRFRRSSCSVRWHQASLEFKIKRNKRARDTYENSKAGIVHEGKKRERSNAT